MTVPMFPLIDLAGRARERGRQYGAQAADRVRRSVALYAGQKGGQKAIVTARALFCGVCEPREDPIEMPELS